MWSSDDNLAQELTDVSRGSLLVYLAAVGVCGPAVSCCDPGLCRDLMIGCVM